MCGRELAVVSPIRQRYADLVAFQVGGQIAAEAESAPGKDRNHLAWRRVYAWVCTLRRASVPGEDRSGVRHARDRANVHGPSVWTDLVLSTTGRAAIPRPRLPQR